MKPIRSTVVAIAALLAALTPSSALRAQDEPTPQFLVERIVVTGLERQVAQRIVLAESRLQEGRSYSEPQLREAVHRINRLPFVVDADMALRRGSERGAYELVIAIEAARPLFYGVDLLTGYAGVSTRNFRLALDTGTALTAGARRFVGSRGLLFASLQTPDTYSSGDPVVVAQGGYTRYGLFRGGYGTVALSASLGGERNEEIQVSVQSGVPLSGYHALRGGLAFTRTDRALGAIPFGPIETEEELWEAQLAWIFDSTDDPLAPSQGSRFTLAGEITDAEQERVRTPLGLPDETLADVGFAAEQWLLRLEGRRYQPLSPRQSVGFGGYAWYTSETVRHASAGTVEDLLGVEALHAVNLRGPGTERRRGDLRLETSVGAQRLRDDDRFGGRDDAFNALGRVSLLFRDAWGLVRVSFVYVDRVGGGR